MSGHWSEWNEAVIVGLTCASITFSAICFARLRQIQRKVIELQVSLFKLSSFLPASSQAALRKADRRIEMSYDGREIEILEMGGQEMVRFEDDLSDEERDRILAYLRDEGFIS